MRADEHKGSAERGQRCTYPEAALEEILLDLHFSFEGKLSRDEAASAFPATLLEQKEHSRVYFLEAVGLRPDNSAVLKRP